MSSVLLKSLPFLLAISISVLCVTCKNTHEIVTGPLSIIPTPDDNLMSEEKIALGKEFFFDKRLSLDKSISCATCHKPGLAFTDGLKVSDGILDRKSSRNSPTLLNLAFNSKFMFDAEIPSLEMQSIVPIQDHNEMGMDLNELLKRLNEVPEYVEAAKKIYNRDMDIWVLTRSLAAYQRSLVSNNSPFDQYYYQNKKYALSPSAKRGWLLFSEKLYCTTCHPAPLFTTNKAENNGVFTNYISDPGRFRVTFDSTDIGKFKVPSLRNIEITDPYMHDGSFEYLEDVIEHYMKGGTKHKNQHPVIQPFLLTKKEKKDLLNFMYSLTDMSFMKRL